MSCFKPNITYYKKIKDESKETTKVCPKCGNTHLSLFQSLNKKYCPDCYTWIDWYLGNGQKPLVQHQR